MNLSPLIQLQNIIGEVLQLGNRTQDLTVDSPLLGSLPELDSMAVVSVITTIEQYFDFIVDDDDISANTFATLGSLVSFVEEKLETIGTTSPIESDWGI